MYRNWSPWIGILDLRTLSSTCSLLLMRSFDKRSISWRRIFHNVTILPVSLIAPAINLVILHHFCEGVLFQDWLPIVVRVEGLNHQIIRRSIHQRWFHLKNPSFSLLRKSFAWHSILILFHYGHFVYLLESWVRYLLILVLGWLFQLRCDIGWSWMLVLYINWGWLLFLIPFSHSVPRVISHGRLTALRILIWYAAPILGRWLRGVLAILRIYEASFLLLGIYGTEWAPLLLFFWT